MAVLSDTDIRDELEDGDLDVSPVDLEEQLQPNSLDIRLGEEYSIMEYTGDAIDPKEGIEERDFNDYDAIGDHFFVRSDEFVLANTIEDFKTPDNLYGQIHGRSSLGRVGVKVHSTAGLIDAGYEGNITLEISCDTTRGVKLYPGMRIAQVVFHELSNPAEESYSEEDNKYQGQEGVTYSRIHQEL